MIERVSLAQIGSHANSQENLGNKKLIIDSVYNQWFIFEFKKYRYTDKWFGKNFQSISWIEIVLLLSRKTLCWSFCVWQANNQFHPCGPCLRNFDLKLKRKMTRLLRTNVIFKKLIICKKKWFSLTDAVQIDIF